MIEIVLYQPDIPQNTGTILRMAACLGLPVHIIEPAGFRWSQGSFRRAGMDYIDHVSLTRHKSYCDFSALVADRRLVLATTKAQNDYTRFRFLPGDLVMFGRESAGVPQEVHQASDKRITIAMQNNMRSLNIAVSAAMICGEAMRQFKTKMNTSSARSG